MAQCLLDAPSSTNQPSLTGWTHGLQSPPLAAGDVHVWRAVIDEARSVVREEADVLSEAEWRQAERLRIEARRCQFVQGRVVLRRILARYAGVAPRDLRLAAGAYGKPFVCDPPVARRLRFNFAHSHGLALCAVTLDRDVGVDLERIRSLAGADLIARHCFSTCEQRVLEGLPPDQRLNAFWTGWTLKESYVKARGDGLRVPLGSFDVSITPGQPRLIRVAAAPGEPRRWQLHSLRPADGYVGAVAVERGGRRIATWHACDARCTSDGCGGRR